MSAVVVTGATGGIGAALVRLFADRGDPVFAAARPSAALDALCADTTAVAAPIDLQRPSELPAPSASWTGSTRWCTRPASARSRRSPTRRTTCGSRR